MNTIIRLTDSKCVQGLPNVCKLTQCTPGLSYNSMLLNYLMITCCMNIFRLASIATVVRTFLKWDERREVLWDIVSPLPPQGVTGVRFKASSRKLQNAALADGKLRDSLGVANRLQVIYIVLKFSYTDSQKSKCLVHITQYRVCTSIWKKRERLCYAKYEINVCSRGVETSYRREKWKAWV